MSETEDLKKATAESKFRQQMDSVSAYLDTLTLKIKETEKQHRISSLIYLGVWIAWVASSFAPDNIHYIFTMAFIFALIYDQTRFTRMMRAYSEFRGCIETLRLLGYLPPAAPDGEKKKRKLVSEFREMVKGWAIKKQKARDAVYAPA